MKDEYIHAFVALGMLLLYSSIPNQILTPLSIVISFYMWEVAQRLVKDEEKRGFLYWWRLDRWGSTAIKEFVWPAVTAIVTSVIMY